MCYHHIHYFSYQLAWFLLIQTVIRLLTLPKQIRSRLQTRLSSSFVFPSGKLNWDKTSLALYQFQCEHFYNTDMNGETLSRFWGFQSEVWKCQGQHQNLGNIWNYLEPWRFAYEHTFEPLSKGFTAIYKSNWRFNGIEDRRTYFWCSLGSSVHVAAFHKGWKASSGLRSFASTSLYLTTTNCNVTPNCL